MASKRQIWIGNALALALLLVAVCVVHELIRKPPVSGDWQAQLSIPSTAEFDGDLVTVRNVRNFRYYPEEKDIHPGYYDRQYDLSKIKGVWYTTEPFNENKLAAHTYISFEFENGDFLAITIEARKTKDQSYSIWKGMARTYPLIYIAADERDVTLMRTNVRKDRVYVYPVKLSNSSNSKILLKNMLAEMNDLSVNPRWYNTLFSNCTSEIAKQVNKITPGRISVFSWQLWLTASADELALKHGLLDTDLPIDNARQKYFVTEKSQKIADNPQYSKFIRK
jgi:hypothetical protein